jgi:hypothetical protein
VNRILIIYYSQTGEVVRVVDRFVMELRSLDTELVFEEIRPKADYPYPWRSIRRFFDVMPECVLGKPPEIYRCAFDSESRFDLVVLAYPVWFLSPALPIQGFFVSPHAAVLENAQVITISVSRAMWQRASLAMKRLLAPAGAVHCDNIVVTHEGSSLLTLISTPRALLFGRRDRFLGMLPRAGASENDLERLGWLGSVVARQLSMDNSLRGTSLLRGEPAVRVNRWLVVPELMAWYCFYAWAVIIRQCGKLHAGLRTLAVYGFALFLLGLIFLGLPLTVLGTWLLYPAIRGRLKRYISSLAAPTGEWPMT